MTRTEFIQALLVLEGIYDNLNVSQNDFAVETWYSVLSHISTEEMQVIIKKHIAQSKFKPTPNDILGHYVELSQKATQMTEVEAWGIVKKAIRNSTYNSKAEFDKLPEVVQRTIGNHEILRSWAMEELDNTDKVIGSQFMRSYRSTLEREYDHSVLSSDVKQLIDIGMKKLLE